MLNFTSEGAKASVRPVITYAFAVGQIGLAVAWAQGGWSGAKDAFAGLSVFTMLIVRDYFSDRKDEEKAKAAQVNATTTTVTTPTEPEPTATLPPSPQ